MRVRFWGVRGSYPVPGPTTNRYGGNTSCVHVSLRDGAVLIIDAGTGIRKLGKELASGALRNGGQIDLLISHTHWDHIQGLPFFAPLYVRGNMINIYGRQRDVHLKTIFNSQTEDPFFPVSLDDVAAQVSYVELQDESRFALEGARIRCARLNHPFIAIGYRVDADGGSMAYISDTAPFNNILLEHEFIPARPDLDVPPPESDAAKLAAMEAGVVDLCQGCDLVIYDTMFRMEEYRARPHWGHSTPEHALQVVEQARASCLVLFHHSPDHTDEDIDQDLERTRQQTDRQVLAAAEGMELSVEGGQVKED